MKSKKVADEIARLVSLQIGIRLRDIEVSVDDIANQKKALAEAIRELME